VALEELGIPAAVIVTSEFVRESRAQSAALGMPQLRIAVIDHPLSTLSSDQITARAQQALPQITRAWLEEGVA
jgi:hypothetical protein